MDRTQRMGLGESSYGGDCPRTTVGGGGDEKRWQVIEKGPKYSELLSSNTAAVSVSLWDSPCPCSLYLLDDDKPKVFLTKGSMRVRNTHLPDSWFLQVPGN